MGLEKLAGAPRAGKIDAVDDGEAKTARWHGVALGRPILVKGDLYAADAWHAPDVADQRGRWMTISFPRRSKQYDAEAFAPIGIGEIPGALFIEARHGLDPTGPVEIGPLVGKAQVRFDDGAANRFQIEHAAVADEVPPHPATAITFKLGVACGVHGPVVEGAAAGRLSRDVTPPARLAIDHRDVGGDVPALEQRHPQMAGRLVLFIFGRRVEDAAADAHAFEVDN